MLGFAALNPTYEVAPAEAQRHRAYALGFAALNPTYEAAIPRGAGVGWADSGRSPEEAQHDACVLGFAALNPTYETIDREVTPFERKGLAAQRRGDGISALIPQFVGTPCAA